MFLRAANARAARGGRYSRGWQMGGRAGRTIVPWAALVGPRDACDALRLGRRDGMLGRGSRAYVASWTNPANCLRHGGQAATRPRLNASPRIFIRRLRGPERDTKLNYRLC